MIWQTALSISALAFWVTVSGQYGQPQVDVAWWSLGMAWFAGLLGRRRERQFASPVWPALFFAVGGLGLAVFRDIQYAWLWAFVLAGGGYYISTWNPSIRFLPEASLGVGYAFALQYVATVGHEYVSIRADASPSVAGALSAALQCCGMDAFSDAATIIVPQSYGVARIPASVGHLGVYPALMLLCSAVPAIYAHSVRPARVIAVSALLCTVYIVFRFLFLISLGAFWSDMELWWSAPATLLTFAPLALVLNVCVYRQGLLMPLEWLPAGRPTARLYSAGALCIGGTALILAGVFREDAGHLKAGRIVVDEAHSDWEWTTEPFDTKSYGLRTSYNYFNLCELLDRHWSVRREYGELTPVALVDCDVLVLKVPTRPYKRSEVEAIERYVKSGGGLWLIGDHTDVFGSATYLNPVAEQFGLRFNADCQYDLETGSLNRVTPGNHCVHPIAAGMPPFLFATSCTIDGGWSTRSVITGSSLRVLPADYSEPNFFPRVADRADFLFGSFMQCASATYGDGRVVAFADSTVFSNFFMYIPGKPELALGTVNWLNHSNTSVWWRYCVGALGAVLAACGLWAVRPIDRVASLAFAWICGASVLTGSMPVLSALNAASVDVPPAHSRAYTVAFDLDHSRAFVPVDRLQIVGDPDYATFYCWVQRLGLVPAMHGRHGSAVSPEHDALAIVNPYAPLGAEMLAGITEFVRGGGDLLLLVDSFTVANLDPLLRDVLGLSVEEVAEAGDTFGSGDVAISLARSVCVQGGEPLLVSEGGKVLATVKTIGLGTVVVCGCSELFESGIMGAVGSVPDAKMLQVFEAQYRLFRELAGL